MTKAILIGLVAAVLAGPPVLLAANVEAGKAISSKCAPCHGPDGKGVGSNPHIAGMSEQAIVEALQAYKKGTRTNAAMRAMARGLSDEDIANLAAYFATLK